MAEETITKAIQASKITSMIYNEYVIADGETIREYNRTLSVLLCPEKDINITFLPKGHQCYTTLEPSGSLRIVIGGKQIEELVACPPMFTTKEQIKAYFSSLVTGEFAGFCHELGHDIFTDMYSKDICEYPREEYRHAMHDIFNIIEDVVIEMAIASLLETDYPCVVSPRAGFRLFTGTCFKPQAEAYKDDETVESFINYLLLVLRVGKSHIPEKNKAYEAHVSGIQEHLRSCISERNATARLKKVIKFVEWLIENIPELDFKKAPNPKEKKSGKFDLPLLPTKDAPVRTTVRSFEEPTEKDEPEEPEDSKETDYTPDHAEDEDIIDSAFNDVIEKGDNHEWVIAKDDVTVAENCVDEMRQQLEEYEDMSKDMSKFLELFKDRRKPEFKAGYQSGRLSIRRAVASYAKGGYDASIFSKKRENGEDPDLAVCLLGDNSGSMCEKRAELCAKAMLAFAQACDWSNIPLSVMCFTKTEDSYSGTCVTVVEKDYDDTLEESLPYFAVNDSKYWYGGAISSSKDIPFFRGNSEEINLFYIWQRLKKVEHKTKLLFVLCDGATTGSSSDLAKVIKQMTEDGIIVIGIGIQCSAITSLYPVSKVFNSEEELRNDLPEYLINTLSEYAI